MTQQGRQQGQQQRKQIPHLQVSPWQMFKSFSVIEKSKFVYSVVRVMLNPNRTKGIFDAIDLFTTKQGLFASEMHNILEQADWKHLAKERYIAPVPVLADLLNLPEGTLGKVFATHMQANNLDPAFFPEIEIKSDLSWLTMRGRQIHDLMHVVTGFGTSVPEELGVQAVGLGIFGDPAAAMIVGGGLMHAGLMKPWILPDCMYAIEQGFIIGKAMKNPLAYKFEENWSKPLAEVRAELNITAPASGIAAIDPKTA